MTRGMRATDRRSARAGRKVSGSDTSELAPNSRAVMGVRGQGHSPLMAAGLSSRAMPKTPWSSPVNSSSKRSRAGNLGRAVWAIQRDHHIGAVAQGAGHHFERGLRVAGVIFGQHGRRLAKDRHPAAHGGALEPGRHKGETGALEVIAPEGKSQ